MEKGFLKEQSNNFPSIELFSVINFVTTNPSYVSAQIEITPPVWGEIPC